MWLVVFLAGVQRLLPRFVGIQQNANVYTYIGMCKLFLARTSNHNVGAITCRHFNDLLPLKSMFKERALT